MGNYVSSFTDEHAHNLFINDVTTTLMAATYSKFDPFTR